MAACCVIESTHRIDIVRVIQMTHIFDKVVAGRHSSPLDRASSDPDFARQRFEAFRQFKERAMLFSTEGDTHESMMIALYPPIEVARQIAAIPGVETLPEDMHITLLYAGSVQEMTDLDVAHIVWATTQWARSFHPFKVKVNGLGLFNPSEGSGDKSVAYAVIDSPEIDYFRNAIAYEIAPFFELRSDHGFNPHITLAYMEKGTPYPIQDMPTIEFEVESVALAMGDRVAHYPLGKSLDKSEDKEDGMTRHHRSILTNMQRVYEMLRTMFSDPVVNRDISLNGIAMQCVSWFEARNMEAGDDWDSYHFLQEVYAAEDGGIYVISVSGGKLFKWVAQVDHSTGDIALGEPKQVTQVFTNSSESRTIRVQVREDGRYEAFAVLSTAMINKDGQIDSRTLFDSFVDRFRGDGSEYINIYHIGHDATRVGELRTIFREGNVLVGYYVLDDNIVAQRVGETLSDPELGKVWGGSIEFWTDEEPEILQIAEGVTAPVFRTGTLLGYSIALVADGAAWGTKHLMVNRMNKTNREKVELLLQGDTEAMAVVESWVDEANERTLKPGIITHTTATDAEAEVDQEIDVTEVEHAVDDGTGNDPAEVATGVDEEMVMWLLDQVAQSEWGTSVDTRIGDLMKRIADAEAIIATMTESQTAESDEEHVADGDQDDEEDVEMQVMNDRVDHVSESVALIDGRLASIEESLQRMQNRQDASSPASVKTVARPAAIKKRPTEQERGTKGDKKDVVSASATWKPTGLFSKK